MPVVDLKADVLWLCEVGHHSDYLSGSQFTPKQVLENRPMLTAVADIIEDLGPYLILVRKNIGIEHLNMHHMMVKWCFSISRRSVLICYPVTTKRVRESTCDLARLDR